LHKTCLELWKMCAEAHMQGLAKAATTINSASLPPGFGDCSGNFRQFSDAFTALKRLLDCPECGTSRLRLARMTDKVHNTPRAFCQGPIGFRPKHPFDILE
uniref:PCIF1_WW domain-containing protein n=1 Tax=Schistocephalus solidus TaxID=70667 RepID=A0A183SYQ5_SCHSO